MFTDGKPEILVVDGFYKDPGEIRRQALAAEFAQDSQFYKGLRSKERFLFPYVRERFQELLGRKILRWTEHGMNGRFQITQAGDTTVYHSDSQTHAGAVYLTPDAPVESGTRFYRSRATGLRAAPTELDARRREKPQKELASLQYDGKVLDRTAWDEVDRVGNVYNRLALWSGRMIHSAGTYFGTTPENSRLVHLYFFDCE